MRNTNQIKLISIFLILILFIQTGGQEQDRLDFGELLLRIFEKLERECFNDFQSILNGEERKKQEKDKNYSWIFDYMGKGFNDIGDESECRNSMKANTTFLLLYSHELNLTGLLEADKALIYFLDIKNYTYGLCIMTSCAPIVVKYLRILLEFVNYINTNDATKDDIVSFIISNNPNLTESIVNSSIVNVDTMAHNGTYSLKSAILWTLVALGVIKLFGGFIRIFTIPKGYDKYIAEKLNKEGDDKDDKFDSEEKSNFLSKSKFNEPIDSESMTKDYNPLFDLSEKMPKKIRLLRLFDLINDFNYLTSKRNRYYNDSGLEILIFNRALMVFCLIFSHTFTSLITLPSEEIINSSFFKSWMNIFFRFSNNALTCWIFLEAAYTTYKLLCFITSEMFLHFCKPESQRMNYELKLLITFLKFIVLLLPKAIFFTFIYTFIYYRIEDYESTSNSPATFRYIFMNLFKEKIKCDGIESTADKLFSNNIADYDECYEFTYFYINMIICILIFMAVTYLLLVIKNKIVEFVLMASCILLFIIPNAFITDDKTDLSKIDNKTNYDDKNITKPLLHYHIIGQTYSTKIFSSFIGFYAIGFIFGFILFNFDHLKKKIHRLLYEYNAIHLSQPKMNNNKNKSNPNSDRPSFNENTNDISVDMESNYSERQSLDSSASNQADESSPDYYKKFILPYYPLRYLNKILSKIYKWKLLTKSLIITICTILFLFIDLILLIPLWLKDSFEIQLNLLSIFFFKYEKHFFILFFFFINIVVLTFPKNSGLKSFMGSKIFVATSRMGFLISCTIHAFTYFSFLIFSIKVKLYVPSFALISFGNYLAIFIVCALMTSVTELPVRIAIKKLMRLNRNKGNIIL